MPQREAALLLRDILEACGVIDLAIGGRSRDEYPGDVIARSAVERQFEIMGEAIRRLLDLEAGLSLRLPESREVIAFRNLIAHGYHLVDHNRVWSIVARDLPLLRARVQQLVQERAGTGPDEEAAE